MLILPTAVIYVSWRTQQIPVDQCIRLGHYQHHAFDDHIMHRISEE